MKGFIEYKERDEGLRVLRAVESIVCVLQSPDGDVFIQTGTSKKDEPVGDFVDGTFEEVKKKFKARCNKKRQWRSIRYMSTSIARKSMERQTSTWERRER